MLLKGAHCHQNHKFKKKMELNTIMNKVALDVIRIQVLTDYDDEELCDTYVHTNTIVGVMDHLNKSDLPDSAQIWITKPPGCKDIQPIVGDFLTCVQSARFPFVSLEFKNELSFDEEYCCYEKADNTLTLCEVADPKIFHHPVFRCGKIDKIRFDQKYVSVPSIEITIKTIEASGLPVKGIERGNITFIYI